MEQIQVRLTDEEIVKKKAKLDELKEDLEKSRAAKGFRKLTKKNEGTLSNKIQEVAKELADEYLARYEALCVLCGMEIRAVMRTNPYNPNVAQAVTELKPYQIKKKNTKPWHEAMADNLHLRAKCEHVLHDEGNVCEKCGLNPENWGESGKGVSQEYFEKMSEKIAEEKKNAEEAEQEETKE